MTNAEPRVDDWRESIKGYRSGKKAQRWTWLVLAGCFLALIAFTWAPWRGVMGFKDVTISTWLCAEPIPDDAAFTLARNSGCEPADLGATIVINDNASMRAPESTSAGSFTWSDLPTASPALTLNVTLPQGAQAVVIADGEPDPPVPISPLNGDRQGVSWSELFRPGNSADFVLFVGPQP